MIVDRLDGIVASLRREEGFSSHAYKDHLGYVTVGVGRCIEEGVGIGLSLEEAEYLLMNDVRRCIGELGKALPWASSLDNQRKEVLVELAFQMGLPNLMKFKRMLAALKDGEFEKAAAELLDSKYAGQTPARSERYAKRIRG
jgi:lysozyme